MDVSDRKLVRAVRRGDADAFGRLFARHRALVLAYLTRRCPAQDVPDLLAETFASALMAMHQGRAPETASLAPWLLTIARNKLVDSRRRGRTELATVRRLALERPEPSDADIEELVRMGRDLRGALALLGQLPEQQRRLLEARVLDERGYDDIAREQNSTQTAVRQRVSRALRRLRTEMEDHRP